MPELPRDYRGLIGLSHAASGSVSLGGCPCLASGILAQI